MFLFASDAACETARRMYKKRRKGGYDLRLKSLVWSHPTFDSLRITMPVLVDDDDPLDHVVKAARARGITPLYIIRLKRFK